MLSSGEWDIAPGTANPVGTDAGYMDSQTVLGLLNAPCNQALPIHWDFQNGSLNRANTVSMGDADGNGYLDYGEDVNQNFLPDAIDRYPDFLDELIVATPTRRLAAVTIVAGLPYLYQIVIFAPGTSLLPGIPSDPWYGAIRCYFLVNDDVAPVSHVRPGAITDECSPRLSSITLVGAENGLINPPSDQYEFSFAYLARPDADGDRLGTSWTPVRLPRMFVVPRVSLDGDLDSDGLDRACDPNDEPQTGGTNSDEDSDGYSNRQDNCPLEPNGQTETNQADADRDGIGDPCDPNHLTVDGTRDLIRADWTVSIGDAEPVWGTLDCDGAPTSRDNQALLRWIRVRQLWDQAEPCPDLGTIVTVGDQQLVWGDIDCSRRAHHPRQPGAAAEGLVPAAVVADGALSGPWNVVRQQ